MPTLRQAADLLAAAHTPDALAALAATLGFVDTPQPLDHAARDHLGLAPELISVHLVRGRGALRALLVIAPCTTPLRVRMAAIATALARHTANVLWLLIASAGDDTGIACWPGDRHPPRLAALSASRRRIVASDAESLLALGAVSGGDDDLLVHTRWQEILGRDALTRRFYRTLERRVNDLAHSLVAVRAADAAELALLTTSRLLFLCFLQAKGWLNGERAFLANRFDECMTQGGRFHQRVLQPLFFGTLNTPRRHRAPRARAFGEVPFLNGGLFARTPLERRHPAARFPDASLGELFAQLLDAYRFTAHEDDGRWSEAAIDPEMLGRAFESLMGARERRTSGAFYTPQPLVAHVADTALCAALAAPGVPAEVVRRALDGESVVAEAFAEQLRHRVNDLTVLDPACGSGAFLVFLLERLTTCHRAVGDARPIAEIRREVLARAIHGVDVNPTAVWLCELRLWLCVVIESDEVRMAAVPPLPNLDCNIRVGDTLGGDAFDEAPGLVGPSRRLVRLRERYARAAGVRKAPLRRALDREERSRALAALDRRLTGLAGARRELLVACRSSDLFGERGARDGHARDEAARLRREAAALRRERRRLADGGAMPFSFPSHFGHVHARGGFRLVIGNPPWVRPHNVPRAERARLRERFVLCRDPGWVPGHNQAHRTFGAQVDLAALFVERSLALAAPGGVIALLLPAKLWRSLSGAGVRRLLSHRASLLHLADWSDAPCAFDAAVYPSVLVVGREPPSSRPVQLAVRRRALAVAWPSAPTAHQLDADAASPWLILPPDVRAAFDLVSARGTALGASSLGAATLGVKCGCNDAFTVRLVDEATREGDTSCTVEHRGRRAPIERAVLRPLLRGEDMTPWRVCPTGRAIVWTHGADGVPLSALPPGAARWLSPWRRRLAARTDRDGARAWWMLFRTDGASSEHARVVWGDFGRRPRAAVIPAGDDVVPLNSCYVLPCPDPEDALALTALLNGPLAAAWLNAIAEPARGEWHRYLAWTVSLLPIPAHWPEARIPLAALARRAIAGSPPSDAELLIASCCAYGVHPDDLRPLVAWCA